MFSLKNKKKLSLNYPQYPQLSGALISVVTGLLHNRIMRSNKQEYLSLSSHFGEMTRVKRAVSEQFHV